MKTMHLIALLLLAALPARAQYVLACFDDATNHFGVPGAIRVALEYGLTNTPAGWDTNFAAGDFTDYTNRLAIAVANAQSQAQANAVLATSAFTGIAHRVARGLAESSTNMAFCAGLRDSLASGTNSPAQLLAIQVSLADQLQKTWFYLNAMTEGLGRLAPRLTAIYNPYIDPVPAPAIPPPQ